MKRTNTDKRKYEDMINLPHHVSSVHPQMDILARAAQFAPFAALTGYDAAIRETARLTDKEIELDEAAKEILDEKLQIVRESIPEQPVIEITYFKPDLNKSGGAYETILGEVKKIDEVSHSLIMQDGLRIRINRILNVEGEILKELF